MKTIAIIGGMGPMASLYAQKQLQKELNRQGKRASIAHVSLDIEPFYTSNPILKLTKQHKELLWQH